MSKPIAPYDLEDLRSFFLKRPFLIYYTDPLLSHEEYEQLKDRQLSISHVRLRTLRGFIAGWLRAKR